MVVLWVGIAVFVLIGLFPPMTDWYQAGRRRAADAQWVECRVDTGRLVGYLAAVTAVTGGFLWSEVQTRPWFRQRADKRKARADNPDRERVGESTPARRRSDVVVAMFCIVAVVIAGLAALFAEPETGSVLDTVFEPVSAPTAELNTKKREEAIVLRQINDFFAAHDMRVYQDFYGKVPDPDGYWADLTPKQKANRIKVCEHAQQILDGAPLSGEQISTEEALMRAHLEVAARGGK